MIESWGNCPNCGAPIRGRECEYCGTIFDFKCDNHIDKSDADRPVLYLDGKPMMFGCSLEEAAAAFSRLSVNAGMALNDVCQTFGSRPSFTIY